MYFDSQLWSFTAGVRHRLAISVAIGLAASALGVARLALLGWLIGRVFGGAGFAELGLPIAAIAGVMLLRGGAEYLRTMVAHETAARVQRRLRCAIYDQALALGPAYFAQERSSELMVSVVDSVEQLETYFGQFLPQIIIACLTPVAVFGFMVFLDVPVALVLVSATLVTLFAPMVFQSLDHAASRARSQAFRAFSAEFLDAVQGLATLKAFGQARQRAGQLAAKAEELTTSTQRVNAINTLGRGITDTGITVGAAAALTLGAVRVEDGSMALTTLLIVLMMGVELFRPLRDLRAQLHTGMLGRAAAQAIFRLLEARPLVTDQGTRSAADLAPDIAFRDVSFRYPGSDTEVHRSLDFHVAAGERVGIVGESGAGKSTLVRLMLRFFDPDSGSVEVGGADLRTLDAGSVRALFAVVNQDTYLFHGSVEDNLRLGKPNASHDELEAAARAANAHAFIERLPQGYATVVGERGIRLSGGQRQRIAIARALLRDAPILVLDEALSAVDAENEATIQASLDRLMVGRTTLIFAHRLSSLIGADRILVLGEGGVVEEGTHDELMARDGVYRSLMGDQASELSAGTPLAETLAQTDRREVAASAATIEPTDAILRAEGLGWIGATRVLLGMIGKERLPLAATFVMGVLRVLAFIGVGVLSSLIVLQVKEGGGFVTLAIVLACAAPLAGIFHWLESWFAHAMAYRLLAAMRVQLFERLEQLAPAYLVHRRTGDLASMATQDVETVEYFYAHTVAPAFVAVLVPGTVLGVLFAYGWAMAVALIPFLALVVLSPFLLRHRLDALGSRSREALGELNAFSLDSIQGLSEVVAFQDGARRRARFEALIDRVRAVRVRFYRDLTAQSALLEIATGMGGLAIIVTGTLLVSGGSLDAGLLPLLALLAMAAFLPVSEIAHIGRQLADTLGAARRLFAIQNERVAVVDGPGVEAPGVDAADASADAGAPAIAFDAVSFTYEGRSEPALDQVTLNIPAGATVALVGSSGAGKTTLAHLLVRFWDPDEGAIRFAGHDLRDYTLDDLRRRVALVAQDTYLFNQTLRENIAIARPGASADAVTDAVAKAALTDVVAALPLGLDTPVGERGARLSGGQRQRVAIARAFLKDAPLLILDEATSHLDAINERAVRRALDTLMVNRTTVVIAHRLSTVRNADLIVVLDEGRVVEQGNHDQLIARGGAYARLVARQISATAVAAGS